MDIWVNNAGLWRTWKPFVETTSDEWKKRLTVLEIACEQKKRGAVIVKRVTAANSDEEQMENVRDHFDYLPDIVE